MGCDKIFGSAKEADECGVCGGDGSSCGAVDGEFKVVLPQIGACCLTLNIILVYECGFVYIDGPIAVVHR